jgi:peroxiredoxin
MTIRSKAFTLAACTLLAMGVGVAQAQEIVNEGLGARRTGLDQMLFKPAPLQAILSQSEWIGTRPTPADLSGKAVLILTWAEWYRPSHAVAQLGQRLMQDLASQGLVVIGVHDQEGWDKAAAFATQRSLGFPIVRDTGGSIRAALQVDQDPDVYVIDRAGQMRYADIATDSARAAVEIVLGEDIDAAAGVQSRLDQEAQAAERARRNPRAINENVALTELPEVPFTPPTAEEYAAAAWPRDREAEQARNNGRGDEPESISVLLPDTGWFRDTKPVANGRARLLYLWHPTDRDSMDRLMFRMDDVQRRLGRDVVVVGALLPMADENRGDRSNDPLRNVEITTATIERFVGNRTLAQHLLAAPDGIQITSDRGRGDRTGLLGLVAVMSSDGVVRRVEHWSQWDDIERALEQVLRADPGVKARREAEAAFIRGR